MVRRPAASVALLAITAVVGGMLTLAAAPSAVAAARPHHRVVPKPKVSGVVVSSHRLPSSGGRVTLAARVRNSTSCTLRARPAIAGLPLTKACGGKRVTWRRRIPANTTATARHYRLTITVRGVHHQRVTRQRSIVVAAEPPPRLAAITQSTTALPSAGGAVTFHAAVANGELCTLSVTPAALGFPSSHSCRGKATGWTAVVPPNPVDSPQTYTFAMTVTGGDSTKVSASRSVTVAAQQPPCPGQTVTAAPTTSAFFNDPTTNAASDQDHVVDAMINAICSVSPPSGGVPSTIDLAMYVYQLEPVTQALLWASTYRGAQVSVVLDGANSLMADDTGAPVANPAYDDLVAGLPAGSVVLCGPNAGQAPPPPIGDVVPAEAADTTRLAATPNPAPAAGTGCAGDNILHTKLLLVSSVDTLHDSAVFTGSQNFNTHGELAAFNNGLELVGNASIYRTSQRYFGHLLADAGAAASSREPALGLSVGNGPVASPQGLVSEDVDPRNTPAAFPATDAYVAANDDATDSTANLLDGVSCTAPGSHAGDHTRAVARTTVQIAMYTYNSRPRITSRLATLARSGCEVHVLYTMMSEATASALDAADVKTRKLSDNDYEYSDGSGSGRVFIHDKYLLISGAYRSGTTTVANQDIVLTGSENFTQAALHQNDDMQVEIRQTATAAASTTALFSAYQSNWGHIAAVIAAISG
jgi:phosphatidylserine/phosphatidylglycerophosphate/cardiolipin synthase-like enzyme